MGSCVKQTPSNLASDMANKIKYQLLHRIASIPTPLIYNKNGHKWSFEGNLRNTTMDPAIVVTKLRSKTTIVEKPVKISLMQRHLRKKYQKSNTVKMSKFKSTF